ncbi:MAG: IMP cyclohydrolase [Candidatus Roizmanbacteria bacterium GW2011_GWA2_37_7]|uniref:Bifunctional purine biosynthesis protein PurH n=1 Tax=Candidatus Roizmanbacteria bacterium GW2011_GWA2_37_7 TaxID=1618481 RepID=A0A0G0KB28_9BACT|nr:MAG: IMP cyclohydrolase [Candidatus Roizmanbacteria bacterium GW2011_GWA2_37_7]
MKTQSHRYALLSVYDKKGIAEFASRLHGLGIQIVSTSGTAKELINNNIPVIPVEKITGNPECFDGRMKTVSFQIESGILFDRSKKKHIQEAKKLKIPRIDIVVCNFYPFDRVVDASTTEKKAIEQIDVGGPTMMRAAAKNYRHVYAIFDPSDYDRVINDLGKKKAGVELRKELAAKAFSYLSWYDAHIAQYLNSEDFPEYMSISGKKIANLRYGDNPHQKAAWYLRPYTDSPLKNLVKLSGRDLSVTNLTDINAGIESVRLFNEPSAVVIKHNTPCGIAVGKTAHQALQRAIEADPVSAFGGVIVMNKPIDMKTAQLVSKFKKENNSHLDIIAAPSVTDTALKLLSEVRKTTGIYTFGNISKQNTLRQQIRWIDGGYALQTLDNDIDTDHSSWKVVTKKKPTKHEMKQMIVAWKCIARVKSNAILIVDQKIPMTRGIGTGQTSRIGAAKIAVAQAGRYLTGAILASDAFFPFSDTVELAAKHKIACIVQPGGSVRDQDSIDAANKAGIVMVFTGQRVFWH